MAGTARLQHLCRFQADLQTHKTLNHQGLGIWGLSVSNPTPLAACWGSFYTGYMASPWPGPHPHTPPAFGSVTSI